MGGITILIVKSIKINQKFIQENNNHFLIKSGKWVVDTPINIFNKDLIIEPGTEIEFSNHILRQKR